MCKVQKQFASYQLHLKTRLYSQASPSLHPLPTHKSATWGEFIRCHRCRAMNSPRKVHCSWLSLFHSSDPCKLHGKFGFHACARKSTGRGGEQHSRSNHSKGACLFARSISDCPGDSGPFGIHATNGIFAYMPVGSS